ncbi:major centromere autoantigen B-like, partial [Pezoporus occidentalis]|uniref:major centromere autoantigen B-like n=1 Tax=Pezoporus occidentalis TaxID=407982 RepID=UPI002F91A8F5
MEAAKSIQGWGACPVLGIAEEEEVAQELAQERDWELLRGGKAGAPEKGKGKEEEEEKKEKEKEKEEKKEEEQEQGQEEEQGKEEEQEKGKE